MSKLDKLSILGVRSFDNQHSMTIAFHTPLTLIVGLNGSGKTTIIECLKYATTGELPPNSKQGGAFIHDPKLCGEKEVLAQVKVGFKSTEGARMVCTRNLQLTVKKTGYSMKTLEGNLLMVREGERQNLSTRVAEIDDLYVVDPQAYRNGVSRLWLDPDHPHVRSLTGWQHSMPRYLGVSKAILESVIFCHQDDSLWPLQEPAKLKVRFDEIFEALKYTKAIDNIKVIKKQQGEKLKEYRIHEANAKENKDKAEKARKRMEALDEDIAKLHEQRDDLKAKTSEASKRAEEAWNRANTAGETVGKLNGKRIERKTKEESVQSLRQNLNEMSDSDDELQRMLEQYEERVQAYEEDLENHKVRYGEMNREVQDTRNRVSAKERELGSYEAQKESYDRQIQSREKLVKETARSHGIRGYDLDIDDQQVREFMDRIAKMAKEQNARFESARRETQEELQAAQKELNQISEKKTALNQRKENARQIITGNDRKIGNLQSQLNDINIDEGGKATMESNLQDTESRLKTAKAGYEGAYWDNQIESTESEMRKHDERKEKLDAELVEGTRQAGDSARLDYVQKELKGKQRSLTTMTGAHSDKITSVVGDGWKPENVEESFQRALNESSGSVTDAERQRDGTSREMEQLDFKLNTCRNYLKNKRADLEKAATAIKEAADCEPQDYQYEVNEMERQRDLLKSEADSFKLIKEYLNSCLKVDEEHKACKTCTRGFKNDKERELLRKNVHRELSKLSVGENDQEEIKKADEELTIAKSASEDFFTWERLKEKEVPALETEEKRLASKREQLVAELESQDGVVSERRAAKRDIEAMSRTVQNIAKYSSEIASFDTQIKELAAKQKAAGLSRGLELIQDDIKKVNDEAKTVKARLTKIIGDRDRQSKLLNSLELEVRDIKSKLSTAEYQLKEKKSLEGQVEELKSLNTEQRDTTKTIDKELQELGPQLSQAQVKYDDVARRGADKDRELQAETNKLNTSVNQLKLADQEISAYLQRGGPEQLKRGKREVEGLKAEVKRLEQEQGQIVRQVKELEDQLRNHSETKRSISDNQRYRRDLRQLQTVREEIKELEKHNAEEEKEQAEREGGNAQLQRNKYAAEQAGVIGQLKSKDDQLKQIIEDWDTDYKDANKQYRDLHIKVETTKACVEDLGRYGGALDKAIMKYHSLKMEEINRIIQELWQKTYQGTDVDTILIKSENENGKSNKSYNYRVCMIKQDAEMDMRGRCSAGQKVLASIIIRLALAECFGVNCGLIALDEPTTNLDRDNIRALAQSLSDIIKMRRAQKNFQLIVITHDEEFLRYMGCSDFADVYYRVSRDSSQKSVIERQSIAEVV